MAEYEAPNPEDYDTSPKTEGCEGCAFEFLEDKCFSRPGGMSCVEDNRDDGKNVIFIRRGK